VPDVPTEVTIQIARNDYLIRKCFIKERDESRPSNVGNDDNNGDGKAHSPVSQRRLEIQIGVGRSGQSQYALGDDPRYEHTVSVIHLTCDSKRFYFHYAIHVYRTDSPSPFWCPGSSCVSITPMVSF
jgi:hypothetical protein